MLPDESLTLTRSGTLVNTTVMSPDWSCAVSCRLDTPVPVMSPESFIISVRAADREVTVMSPEWSLIVAPPEIWVALMSPEPVLSVTGPARPLAVRLPEPLEISDLAPAGTATA